MPDDKITPEPDDKKGDEGRLSPREELELERLKAHTAELESENRDLTVPATYEREIAATGIRSNLPQKDLVKLLTAQPNVKIVPSANGTTLHCEVDGKPVEFAQILEQFAIRRENQYLFDGRSLKRLKQDEQRVTCKDDLTDKEDKIAYLSKFGDDAYGKLPQHRLTTHEDPAKTMTREEYLALPMPTRAKLCGELSELQITRILQRSKEKK